ncbi:translocation/assembly module TamB domain-containing protein [Sphingobium sp. BYY-5]|uniref:translocation/assembly module TamB domain-containing protein n=1 Tax=Sphingobium sp. BYY-5 TaxID=2926400 RepID=UPI001FA7C3FD|nr:translocation/assembly module TamB domain-containing protein [Sphingobium sp. BYY-5]MCI4589916.1 translocation/assembly module TamB domain-containing protein [Sphingobium sp. BYY-5]
MAEETSQPAVVPPPPPTRHRRAWDGRWQRWLAGLLAAALLIVVGALVWLDTSGGHRFLASRIATIKSASGLRIEVGGIEGSIYRKAVLRDLTLSDPKGRFLDAPRVELDWWPFAWLSNRLDIDRLAIPQATLHKLPQLNPTQRRGPILPGFDIRLMQFSVGRLTIAPGITGRAQTATMTGDADIRGGRAIIDLSARTLDGSDALTIALDSRPDNDRFQLDVTVNAPKNGVLAAMAGLKQDANLRIGGKGSWSRWDGRLSATLDGAPTADMVLAARSGAYSARGTMEGAAIAGNGLLRRMADPRLSVRASGTMVDRVIDGKLTLRSAAFDLDADGAIDLRNNALDNLLITLKLARPQALLKTMRGRDIAAKVRLDGPFSAPGYEYLLTARELVFDKTVIRDVRAEGKGRHAGKGAALIPVKLRAHRLDGQGDLVEGIVRNFQLDGVLQLKGQQIIGNPMQFRSDKLRGKLAMIADLKTGRYDVGLDGQLNGLFIRGLGVVDLTSKLHAAPRRDGGFGLSGNAQARVRRLDNDFLRTLGGGLPSVRSALELRPDGQIALSNLRLDSPLLTLAGQGLRHRDGSLHLEASGRHGRYGPVTLMLDGMIEHPTIDLLLARPMDALGLRDVRAKLIPDATTGYSYTAQGGSTLGPFTGHGVILLPPGGQAVVRVANLAVSGVTASGDIRPIKDGLDGQLSVIGPVTGYINFKPVNDVQQVQLKLNATDASFEGPTVIAVRRGTLDGTILLDPDGTTVTATAQARGLRVGGVLLGRFAADAALVDGKGKISGSLSGQRGRIFDLQGEAQVEPDRIRLSASGTVDKRPIRLTRAALLTRTEDGWRLSPATLSYAGGSLQLAGELGAASTHVEARMEKLPLSLLDIAYDNLGLGGMATGSLSYAQPRGGLPSGKAELRIRGLSRSGLSLSSRPVDVGVNAALTPDRLATRMVFVADGKTIGRAQALLTPLSHEGGLVERLNAAQLFAQLRYGGTADTLWRLLGVEIVDIAGPVSVSADMRGTLGDPRITGQLATDNATINSPVTGMRLRDVKAQGRFSGAQLVISSFAATAQNGGTVNGTGRFTFNGIGGVGMDLALQANNAALLERDDIAATVTGPITLRSDGVGGTIGGDLVLNRSRFTMGRAAAVAQIPELRVIEVNRRGEEIDQPRATAPWTLAVKARARNRLTVTGLGLDSEWRADLNLGGTVTNPAIAGRAELVRGGYEFAGRRFDLREGHIQFDGKTPVNPTLDISAEADVSDLSATIHVGGTGLKPDITFTSTPALPQDELLSRILFGTSITNLSAPEALQLASAVGSLQGNGGLDPINAVRKAAGLDRLRIIAADPTQGQGTSIAAGKYLTRKTYVELITDGQGYSATRMEYQVTRWLSLLGAISTLGRQSANVRISKDY